MRSRLIASQSLAIWSSESSMGDLIAAAKADALSAAPRVAAPASSGICLECLRKATHFGSSMVIRE
ncbi:hypothetical protein [Denitromonas sp.]|uniref:hypothetical protein n=1 Tax=Denitromonas sp. TaxID=2734609 RepID=UPI002AFF43DD|nr:hypothetical protein [Denitromonas sp.]